MSTTALGPPDSSWYNRSPLIKYTLMLLGVGALSLLVWPGLLRNLLNVSDYMPHGMCLLWEPRLLWLHISSDSAIGISYVAISLTLGWLVHRARRDIPFSWMFLAFGLFIIACGATHLMEVVTLWYPYYWLSGDLKLITAIASVATAIALPPLVPKILDIIRATKIAAEQRKQIEAQNRELAEMTRKLKQADELKTQFFSNVSHELRTPLALVLGRTERLLESNGITREQRRELEVVQRSSRTLLKQVNDLLDLAKLESGRMEVQYSQLDLARLVRRTLANFDSIADEREMKLIYEVPDELTVQVDADKIERILLNLLSNAFKFTPDGGTVRCALRKNVDQAVIEVSDSGPGIPVEMREVVFERFRQLDGRATRRFGGIGLGLAIVKDFVDLHKGYIEMGDADEGGAKVTITIPVSAPQGAKIIEAGPFIESWQHRALQSLAELTAAQAEPVSQAAEVEQGLTAAPLILVIEDNLEMNRFIVESLAGEYRVLSAHAGREGLQLAMQTPPDVILADVMMPDYGGEDLLRDLRARHEFDSVPIVLITAKADRDARLRALRAGAQDYIMKPFLVEELQIRLRNLIVIGRIRRLLQKELNTQTHDFEQLIHEVSVRRRQLSSALDALRASEARFRTLVESNILGVITAGFDGSITEANEAFLRMLGYSSDDFKQGFLNWRSITPPEHTEADLQALQQLSATGAAVPWQKEYVAKDGTKVPVLMGAAKLDGLPERAVAFVLDLTEQRRAEARTAVQYAVARILADSSSLEEAAPKVLHGICEYLGWDHGEIWDFDDSRSALRCIETCTCNSFAAAEVEHFTRSTKLRRGEGLPGRVWSSATPCWVTDLSGEHNTLRAPLAISEGLHSACGFPVIVNNEVLGVFAFFSCKPQEPDPEVLQLLAGIGSQIGQFVERKRGEAALRESEGRFRSAVDAMPQIVWTTTPEGELDFYNQRWYDYTGLTYEQTKRWGWELIVHSDDLQGCLDRWSQSLATGRRYEAEYRLKRYDGVYRWYLGRAVPLRDSNGNITKWFGTSTDIHDQKQAEIAKRELAAIVESSDDAILGKTLDGRVTNWNRGAQRIYGYTAEEMIGRPIFTLSPPDRQNEMTNILERLKRGEGVEHLQTVRKTKDGRLIDVSLSVSVLRNEIGEIIGGSIIARDITEMKRAEQALRNSEKHAMVGRLSAIMAHEINNPLEAVSNVLYLLGTRPDLDDESRQYVNIASQEMGRIAHIVKQTLGFYRESPLPIMIRIPELVDDIIGLYARKLADKKITVERHYENVGDIPAIPSEIRQVFSNLIINAIEASRTAGTLRVHIIASRDWGDTDRCGVRVVVGDTGTGIAPEHRQELFEPFFTTKGEKGTGLGLWVSNGIIQKHGGSIRVRSSVKPGHSGTCFSVFLPSESPQVSRAAINYEQDVEQSEIAD